MALRGYVVDRRPAVDEPVAGDVYEDEGIRLQQWSTRCIDSSERRQQIQKNKRWQDGYLMQMSNRKVLSARYRTSYRGLTLGADNAVRGSAWQGV